MFFLRWKILCFLLQNDGSLSPRFFALNAVFGKGRTRLHSNVFFGLWDDTNRLICDDQ